MDQEKDAKHKAACPPAITGEEQEEEEGVVVMMERLAIDSPREDDAGGIMLAKRSPLSAFRRRPNPVTVLANATIVVPGSDDENDIPLCASSLTASDWSLSPDQLPHDNPFVFFTRDLNHDETLNPWMIHDAGSGGHKLGDDADGAERLLHTPVARPNTITAICVHETLNASPRLVPLMWLHPFTNTNGNKLDWDETMMQVVQGFVKPGCLVNVEFLPKEGDLQDDIVVSTRSAGVENRGDEMANTGEMPFHRCPVAPQKNGEQTVTMSAIHLNEDKNHASLAPLMIRPPQVNPPEYSHFCRSPWAETYVGRSESFVTQRTMPRRQDDTPGADPVMHPINPVRGSIPVAARKTKTCPFGPIGPSATLPTQCNKSPLSSPGGGVDGDDSQRSSLACGTLDVPTKHGPSVVSRHDRPIVPHKVMFTPLGPHETIPLEISCCAEAQFSFPENSRVPGFQDCFSEEGSVSSHIEDVLEPEDSDDGDLGLCPKQNNTSMDDELSSPVSVTMTAEVPNEIKDESILELLAPPLVNSAISATPTQCINGDETYKVEEVRTAALLNAVKAKLSQHSLQARVHLAEEISEGLLASDDDVVGEETAVFTGTVSDELAEGAAPSLFPTTHVVQEALFPSAVTPLQRGRTSEGEELESLHEIAALGRFLIEENFSTRTVSERMVEGLLVEEDLGAECSPAELGNSHSLLTKWGCFLPADFSLFCQQPDCVSVASSTSVELEDEEGEATYNLSGQSYWSTNNEWLTALLSGQHPFFRSVGTSLVDNADAIAECGETIVSSNKDADFGSKYNRMSSLEELQSRYTIRIMDKDPSSPIEFRIYRSKTNEKLFHGDKAPTYVAYGDGIFGWIDQWMQQMECLSKRVPDDQLQFLPTLNIWFDKLDIHMQGIEAIDAKEFIQERFHVQ
ncbi:hypothetical protein ACA910_008159 [Epithemia clementina (nom. ined.)]